MNDDALPKILIIDDDIELCEMLSEYLMTENFLVETVQDGQGGFERAISSAWDAIVLDVMLPKADGFTVLRQVREKSRVPILMLTAKGEDIDRIVGLEMGADDYLPKPCNPRELIARLRAILRRTQQLEMIAGEGGEVLIAGGLKVTPASRQVHLDNESLVLTSTEYNLLEVLIRHKGTVVNKNKLSEEAMGRELTRYDRSIDMHLSKLRQKLGDHEQQLIQTIRGVGYQLCDPSS